MAEAPATPHPRVVVAGAGIAGIETALALRALTDAQAAVTVVDPGHRFAIPATATGSAFGITPSVDLPLSRLVALTGAHLRSSRLVAVDARRRLAMLAGGELLGFENLVVAIGARAAPHLPEALTFRGHADVEELRDLVESIAAHAERGGFTELAVVIPAGCSWPLAGYEIALMTREHLVSAGQAARVRVTIVTAEEVPLAMFGAPAGRAVERKLRRAEVEIVAGSEVEAFDWGCLVMRDGGLCEADRVVALPVMRGPGIRGLPVDPDGFVVCDAAGVVADAPGVRVVGDAGTFALKEGGLACHQADRAAASIAREHGADVEEPPLNPPTPEWLRDDGNAPRWPVPKVAGRFLAPFLHDLTRRPAGVTQR